MLENGHHQYFFVCCRINVYLSTCFSVLNFYLSWKMKQTRYLSFTSQHTLLHTMNNLCSTQPANQNENQTNTDILLTQKIQICPGQWPSCLYEKAKGSELSELQQAGNQTDGCGDGIPGFRNETPTATPSYLGSPLSSFLPDPTKNAA